MKKGPLPVFCRHTTEQRSGVGTGHCTTVQPLQDNPSPASKPRPNSTAQALTVRYRANSTSCSPGSSMPRISVKICTMCECVELVGRAGAHAQAWQQAAGSGAITCLPPAPAWLQQQTSASSHSLSGSAETNTPRWSIERGAETLWASPAQRLCLLAGRCPTYTVDVDRRINGDLITQELVLRQDGGRWQGTAESVAVLHELCRHASTAAPPAQRCRAANSRDEACDASAAGVLPAAHQHFHQ